ncbi:divergent polysaccharide deacetylase family protein [Desertibacillus haloalkaliphilus]|nr:divergent polysaccharide deacetylase family protein [Desertibacillus haloalkaliphilus]
MKKLLLFLFISASIVSLGSINYAHAKEVAKAAIIIDDFGGDVKGVDEFFESDIPITVAIMPFLAESEVQAELAHEKGLEVMLHLPLQPKKGKSSWLGPNPITADLPIEEIKKRVEAAIESIPHVKGINNHMGSRIVEDEDIMRAILEVAKEHNLYFIDSGTSGNTVIPKLAEELGVPWAMRDVFLDDTHSSHSHVNKQMKKLAKVAQKKGSAIGIGHVGIRGTETVKGVKQSATQFQEKQVEIVPVSHLLKSSIDKNPDKFWQN